MIHHRLYAVVLAFVFSGAYLTPCSFLPLAFAQASLIDVQINGTKGPIFVPNGTVTTLSWTSQDVDSCTYVAEHDGTVVAQGPTNTFATYIPTPPIIPPGTSLTFTITCKSSTGDGSVFDSVTATAMADPWAFVNPQPVTIRGYSGATKEPQISRDGQYLFFNNGVAAGVKTKLYYATRVTDTIFDYQGELGGVNTSSGRNDNATIDGSNRFYFSSDRSYLQDMKSIYTGLFTDGVVTGVMPVAGVIPSIPGYFNMDQGISPDGNTLYYSQEHNDLAGHMLIKLFVAARTGPGIFQTVPNSEAILKIVNERGQRNFAPDISADGLELFFTRLDPVLGYAQLYVARRSLSSEVFKTLQLVAEATGFVEAPSLTLDGKRLYYHVGTGQPPPATDLAWRIYTMERPSRPLAAEEYGFGTRGEMPNAE